MKAQFPIYIPSKGRFEIRLTSDALTRMKQPHIFVVEEQEYSAYREAVRDNLFASVIVLDDSYKDRYELCDDLGRTKSTGPGPARNFLWDHSIASGFAWHWTMDDNIREFYRLNDNRKIRVYTGAIFRAMEDFCLRYLNVYMAGPNYAFFAKRKQRLNPLILNTRIYSCNLIRNDIPFRWRGRYNEDTILSLDILKAGFCTVQFNAFLQSKARTQVIKGGNTAEFYSKEGTAPKSEMQVKVHPDVSRLTWRFGRVHHFVDYTPFRKNRLILKPECRNLKGVDEYGMTIAKVRDAKPVNANA